MINGMKINILPVLATFLIVAVGNNLLANNSLKDTIVAPPFATTSYNDSFYSSTLSAAEGIAQPFLLQQGYLTLPGVTVIDTSLVYNGIKYLTSNVYFTPRTISRTGFYISSTDYPYYGITNFSSIWSKECPNIFFDTSKNLFHTSTDCIGYGVRVIAAVGGTSAATNAYLKFANAILKAKICHLAPLGHAPDSYEMAAAFATLPSTAVAGWQYISGNGLYTYMNTYNHTLDNTLGDYTGTRKGGFGWAKAGDLLCFGDGPNSSSNGHTMIMASDPIKLTATSLKTFFPTLSSSKINTFISKHTTYQVNIYDDCDHLHFNDSRAVSNITGVGYGTILIVTDTVDDAPVGYFFTPSTSLNYTALDTNKTYAICVARYTNPTQLPVSNESFTADVINGLIQLKWQINPESNSTRYTIQHSTDAKSFEDISTIQASHNLVSYQFTDKNPAKGLNYYRLIGIDNNGSKNYSKIINVQFSFASSQLSVFPNPAKNRITIKGSHIVNIQLIDTKGRVLIEQILKDATNPLLNLGNLARGKYFLSIKTQHTETTILSLIKD